MRLEKYMDNEIIEFMRNNISTIVSPVNTIVGAILSAIFLRKNTSIEEIEKIKNAKFSDALDELIKSGKMTYTELYKTKNFLKIAEKADRYYEEKYSKNSKNNKQNEFDWDWYFRFYESAGNISDEELQILWAKILAGEINESNTFSLRMLDVFKNIRKNEAQMFMGLLNHCVIGRNNAFLPYYNKFLERSNISYSTVLYMAELGLLFNDPSLVLERELDEKENILFDNQSIVVMASKNDSGNNMIKIKQFPLTTIGCELASIIGAGISDEDFIELMKEIKEAEGHQANIVAHKILNMTDTTINYSLEDLLE